MKSTYKAVEPGNPFPLYATPPATSPLRFFIIFPSFFRHFFIIFPPFLGRLGKRSYLLWGNYFIIKNKYDPIYIFLKREGLQHDYLYHNFYLRVGDHIVFYLIKGGNNI